MRKAVWRSQSSREDSWNVLAAGWFWDTNALNALADEDGIRRITRRINGGLKGLEERVRYLDRAKLVLK